MNRIVAPADLVVSKQKDEPRQKGVKEQDGKNRQDSSRRNNVLSDKDSRCPRRPQKGQKQNGNLYQGRKGSQGKHFEKVHDDGRQGHWENTVSQNTNGLEKGNGSSQELRIDCDNSGSTPHRTEDGGKDETGLSHGRLEGQEHG